MAEGETIVSPLHIGEAAPTPPSGGLLQVLLTQSLLSEITLLVPLTSVGPTMLAILVPRFG